MGPGPVAQLGLPELVPDLVGLAGSLLLVLMLVALAGAAYKHFTGGIEWPEGGGRGGSGAGEEDGDELRRGDDEEEWEYY